MFWTGGSKNNLQRKNKNLMISRPLFYHLRKALLKETSPQSLFPKHGHALQLWSSRFSLFLFMIPPFHSWWLCSVPASVPTPRGETSPSFFLLSSCSTFLMDLPQFGFFGSKGLPCHLVLDIMVLFIFCLCLYTLILLLVSQNYSHKKVSILAFFIKIFTCRIA